MEETDKKRPQEKTADEKRADLKKRKAKRPAEPKLNAESPKSWSWGILIDLYIFGDRFDVPKWRNAIINAAIDKILDDLVWQDLPAIKYAFENLPSGSPLLKLLVHQCAYNEVISVKDAFLVKMPPEYLVRVLEITTHRLPAYLCDGCYAESAHYRDDLTSKLPATRDGAPYRDDACEYHEHADDEERTACRKSREEELACCENMEEGLA